MGCAGSKEPSPTQGGQAETKAIKYEGSVRQRTEAEKSFAMAKKASSKPDPKLGLEEIFECEKFLGEGGTGKTYLMKSIETGEEVAVKAINRPVLKDLMRLIKREIMIQAELGEGHRNIVNLFEVLLTPTHLCLVMEYVPGGSLTSYITSKFPDNEDTSGNARGLYITEAEACYFFTQFINAVEYCHTHNVMHRDLKLDNTLLTGKHPPVIKICDFGFAKSWNPAMAEAANTSTQIGTPVYMPPEVLSTGMSGKAYDGKAADVWSSGVMLFVMLIGGFPYDHTTNPDPDNPAAQREVLLQQITTSWKDCHAQPFMKRLVDKLSPDLRDLLDRIFVTDATQRITIDEIKQHPWIVREMGAMPEEYRQVLDALADEQRAINRKVARNKQLAKEIAGAAQFRQTKLTRLLDAALKPGKVAAISEDPMQMTAGEQVERIDLRQGIDHFVKGSVSFAKLQAAMGPDPLAPSTVDKNPRVSAVPEEHHENGGSREEPTSPNRV
ncbi:unnamed protein product [Pedinophyceae sp. YPF-701]|nr:unnamed protein product [Pedinophyceae sp. YPF-701]